MGCDYSACVDLEVLDEKAFLLLSRQAFAKGIPHLKSEWTDLDTVDDIAGFVVARDTEPENFSRQRYGGGAVFHNCFKATYSWLPFMEEWFKMVASSLGNKSAMLIDGECHSENYVRDGVAEGASCRGGGDRAL